MQYFIYLLKNYNNYYNRKVIVDNTLSDILGKSDYQVKGPLNFNPNDDIETEVVLNIDDEWIPDYLLVKHIDSLDDDFTRWFVLECTRLRTGQYKLNLKRDTIADKFNNIKESPIYIEKAMANIDDPLLFNSEGMTFNEIKKSEILLKDESNTNWIVGYFNQDSSKLPAEPISSVSYTDEYVNVNELNLEFNDPTDISKGAKFTKEDGNLKIGARIAHPTDKRLIGRLLYCLMSGDQYNRYSGYSTEASGATDNTALVSIDMHQDFTTDNLSYYWSVALTEDYGQVHDLIISYLEDNNYMPIPTEDSKKIMALDQKVVLDTVHNKYYQLQLTTKRKKKVDVDISQLLYDALMIRAKRFKELLSLKKIKYSDLHPEFERKPFSITVECTETDVSFVEVPGPGTITVSLSKIHQKLVDAPFDMFAIPYSVENLNLATQINLKLGSNMYDIQLLPYCPVRKLITENGIDLSLGKKGIDFDNIINEANENVSYILYAEKSSDTFTINKKIIVPKEAVNLKIHNETTRYRLVSPNYNGIFEFSPAKNYGVDYFKIDFTYKPYTPYIHVAPNFKGLYGYDFNDARGLICNGDFSIATTSSAWTNYEINNKNYQNIFNTEIKSMDDLHDVQVERSAISAVMSATGTGAIAGGLTGKPAVGVLTGLASAGAGIADIALDKKAYNIGKQAKINNYNYSLGNIKARPNSLTKVSAYNVNNKYFPFLEIYSSTDEEKEILRDKIKYDGMTIMKIGKISDYLNYDGFSYFKGQLIRLEGIGDEAHMVQDIANELNRGVYL